LSTHQDRLLEHRRIWRNRPILQEVYRDWFAIFLETIPVGARVVEVGAGPGFLTEHARLHRPDLHWIATELLPVPWNDAVADAERLPFRDGSIDAVVGLDVLHHLSAPRRFLLEAARVLVPGGTLIFIEPWVTAFSYPIYRWLHQEGCDIGIDPWHPFPESSKDPWDGDAAVPWGLVRKSPDATWDELGLSVPRVRLLNGFAYLATLGFRERSLLPAPAIRWLQALDALCSGLASIFGLRAVLAWRRATPPRMERAAQD
jgi:SAM-dependent methyltransferase